MLSMWVVTNLIIISLKLVASQEVSNRTFPTSFKFGAASSAYQVEGAWNEDGKGLSIWDSWVHTIPVVIDGSTGDVACDSYHRYPEDIAALKEMGMNFYRFSISWPRILPTGFRNVINPAGVQYYNNLINGLLAAGIEPWVTMYHWDLPLPIDYLGGWKNEEIVRYFTDYADLLFELFGDRVKRWITINEPVSFCVLFTTISAERVGPGIIPTGIAEYLCSHNVLKTHSKVYRLYERKYKRAQKGRISLVVVSEFPVPASTSAADIAAAQKKRDFDLGLYLHPLVYGDYPQSVVDQVANYSSFQGYPWSRLPCFTLLEKLEIKGAFDFISLNHYSSALTVPDNNTVVGYASYFNDDGATLYTDPSWEGALNKIYPQGFWEELVYIKENYGNPEIAITEQGYADTQDVLYDPARINYFKLYLSALLRAIYENQVRVIGYAVWSLLDSFEWNSGYTAKMGLYRVDFQDVNRTRTPKESSRFFKNVTSTRCLVDVCV